MKKFLFILLCGIVLLVGATFLLNIDVTIKQGINFKVSIVKIPVYLKILDFYDRHYNYKELAKKIIKDSKSDEEQAVKIFKWTLDNIKNVPDGLPVMDDHVWYTIIRGYGTDDQRCDVFATLCNYAGLYAFFDFVYTKESNRRPDIPLSFVRLYKKWRVFDPGHGIYFVNETGDFASVEEIRAGNWQIKKSLTQPNKVYPDYKIYFANLPIIKNGNLSRSNIQSPFRRLIFGVKRWIERK